MTRSRKGEEAGESNADSSCVSVSVKGVREEGEERRRSLWYVQRKREMVMDSVYLFVCVFVSLCV